MYESAGTEERVNLAGPLVPFATCPPLISY
jgi:hypothetical protein